MRSLLLPILTALSFLHPPPLVSALDLLNPLDINVSVKVDVDVNVGVDVSVGVKVDVGFDADLGINNITTSAGTAKVGVRDLDRKIMVSSKGGNITTGRGESIALPIVEAEGGEGMVEGLLAEGIKRVLESGEMKKLIGGVIAKLLPKLLEGGN